MFRNNALLCQEQCSVTYQRVWSQLLHEGVKTNPLSLRVRGLIATPSLRGCLHTPFDSVPFSFSMLMQMTRFTRETLCLPRELKTHCAQSAGSKAFQHRH